MVIVTGIRSRNAGSDRGQAYTLEGFIGAIVVLTALLFAQQAIVITPTTGGSLDRTVQDQLQQEAKDSLVVAANDRELSELIRYWDNDSDPDEQGDFYNSDPSMREGEYNTSAFSNESMMGNVTFGAVLQERFQTQGGYNYNVELVYYENKTDSDRTTTELVRQGSPSPNAFTASYVVTLYDDQPLTAPGNEDVTLAESDHEIPNLDPDSDLYNVVEVRIVVWR